MSSQQLYEVKPIKIEDVQGASSQTIFAFMTTSWIEHKISDHPWDVDGWERNRALLICYPEWKLRLKEMSNVSKYWKVLVENWETIEEKYNLDYEKYKHKAFGKGECDTYIRSLICSVKK